MRTNEFRPEIRRSDDHYQLYINDELVVDHDREETRGTDGQAKEYYDSLVQWEVAWYTVNGDNCVSVDVTSSYKRALHAFKETLQENRKQRVSNYKWANDLDSKGPEFLSYIWDCEMAAVIGEGEERRFYVKYLSVPYYFPIGKGIIINKMIWN
jgi:hypothetical protein